MLSGYLGTLRELLNLALTFKKIGKLDLIVYTNFDIVGSLIDHRSTIGYCTISRGNLITSRSKKQRVVSKLITEAEFWALSSDIDEMLWTRDIFKDLNISYEELMKVRCHNKPAINIAHEPVYRDKINRANIDCSYIKEKLEGKIISTIRVSTTDQFVDVFTKGLPIKFLELVHKLGTRNSHSCAWGGVLEK